MEHSGEKIEFHEWDFAYGFKFRRVEERFDKLWEMKVSARESLEDWLLVSDIPPRSAEICANACSELIENSIKYARNDSVANVLIRVLKHLITIETCNIAEKTHRDMLQHSLAELKRAPDLKRLFVEKLLNPLEGKSQLGLIKIVMETRGVLEYLPSEDEEMIRIRLSMNAE